MKAANSSIKGFQERIGEFQFRLYLADSTGNVNGLLYRFVVEQPLSIKSAAGIVIYFSM